MENELNEAYTAPLGTAEISQEPDASAAVEPNPLGYEITELPTSLVSESSYTEAIEEKPRKKPGPYAKLSMALFLFAVVDIGLQFALSYLVDWLWHKGVTWVSASWVTWVISFVPLYLFAIPFFFLLTKKLPANRLPEYRMPAKYWFGTMAVCLCLMYAGNIVGNILGYLLSHGTAQNDLIDYVSSDSWLQFPVMVIAAPILEELVFRKLLIDRASVWGEKGAIVFSALAFSLFHMNIYQMVYAFLVGLVFGYVYCRTGRLRYSILMHMVINFLGSEVAMWVLEKSNAMQALLNVAELDTEALLEAMAELYGQLIAVYGYVFLIFGAAITGLVLLIKNRKKLAFRKGKDDLSRRETVSAWLHSPGFYLFAALCLILVILNLGL